MYKKKLCCSLPVIAAVPVVAGLEAGDAVGFPAGAFPDMEDVAAPAPNPEAAPTSAAADY